MATLFLIRHGLTAQTGHTLYGRTRGIPLDHRGEAQAVELAARFSSVRLTAIYSSPLERCTGTVVPLGVAQRLPVTERDDLIEMDAGTWTGKQLSALRRQKSWATVQQAPSEFRFPGGEGFVGAQARTVAEVERIARRHPRGRVAIATHGDIVRIVLAHFLATPLDRFQRIVIDTASVSVVAIHRGSARVLLVNDAGGLDRFGHSPALPWEAPTQGRSRREMAG